MLKLGWEPSHVFSRVFALLFVPQGSGEQFKWFDDLQSSNHILLENEPAFSKLLEEVSEFIGRGERRQIAGGRREADRAR